MANWESNPDGSARYNPDAQAAQPAAGASGQPGWGPIKISGQFTPHPNSPGDFWHHIGSMGSGQTPGGGAPPSPDMGSGGMTGKPFDPSQMGGGGGQMPQLPGPSGGSWGGQTGPINDFPPYGGQFPPGTMTKDLLQQAPQIPMPEGKTYDDFQRDYWAPDRDQVLAGLPQPTAHFDGNQGLAQSGGSNPLQGATIPQGSGLVEQMLQRAQQNPQQGQGGGIWNNIGGALGKLF